MEWLNDNWFKLGLLIAIFVALGMSYSYLVERQKNLQQANCQQLAMKEKGSIEKGNEIHSFKLFEYGYSSKARGCVVAYVLDGARSLAGRYDSFRWYKILNLSTGSSIYEKNPAPGEESLSTNTEFNETMLLHLPTASVYQ